MKIPKTPILLVLGTVLSNAVNAQQWRIKSYNTGYRIFEISAVGNNPITIIPLLKDPVAYESFLNTITINSLSGNPEITPYKTFYINAEFKKDSALSRFWEKHSLQGGLHFTTRISQYAGAVANEEYFLSPDTVFYRDTYSLVKFQQFLGVNIGLNRRFNISQRLSFLIGLHAQGSFAIIHHYQQRWDSSVYTPTGGWDTKTTHLPNLKGKNFFQWQIMMPLGLEYEFKKEKFLVRLELNAGVVGSRYRPKNFAASEAHGIGIWLIYKPNRNRQTKNNRTKSPSKGTPSPA
jgi:hypothetical protein